MFVVLLCLLVACLAQWGQQGGHGQQQEEKLQIDPYEVLGLPKDATPKQIKKAYRVLSMKNHPDKNKSPDAVIKMQEVSQAYEMIGDPDQKVIFDEFGNSEKYYSKWQFEQAQRRKGKDTKTSDFYSQSEDVATLSTKNFYQFLTKGGPCMVEFYAPWCVHCQDMVGEYKKLAILLEDRVRMGAVNCESAQAVCNSQNVQGYPSLRLFVPRGEGQKGMDMEEYQGDHKAEAIYSFVDVSLSNDLVTLSNDFHSLVSESDDLWLVDFSAGQWCGPCQTLKKFVRATAHTLQGRVRVGIINCDTNPELCQEMNVGYYPQLRVFKRGVTPEVGQELKAESHFPAANVLSLMEQLIPLLLPASPGDASESDLNLDGDEHAHSEL